uniref:Small ribosomal subunit protein uS17 n=1 Tax=Hucho hucho TaxID=62062 RepID=A0A4W5KER8_9TELE
MATLMQFNLNMGLFRSMMERWVCLHGSVFDLVLCIFPTDRVVISSSQPSSRTRSMFWVVVARRSYHKSLGLGFKTPGEAIDGTYIDKKCPFIGIVSIRGRILSGVVTKMKMQMTSVVRCDYLHYIRKYNRFEKAQEHVCISLNRPSGSPPPHILRMTSTVVRTPARNTPTVCQVGVPK